MSDAFWTSLFTAFGVSIGPCLLLIVGWFIKRFDEVKRDALVATVAEKAQETATHVVTVKDTLATSQEVNLKKLEHIETLVNSQADQARAEIRALKGELLLRIDQIVVLQARLQARRATDDKGDKPGGPATATAADIIEAVSVLKSPPLDDEVMQPPSTELTSTDGK